MTRLSPHRWEARVRRRTAVHEAGHYVVARHLGVRSGAAWIFRAPGDADLASRRSWAGKFSAPRQEMNRLSARRLTMTAVAGIVAEHAWDSRRQQEEWGECCGPCVSDWELDTISESDRDLAYLNPDRWDRRAERCVDDVWELLRPDGGPLWRAILDTARALIRHGAVEARPGLLAEARGAA